MDNESPQQRHPARPVTRRAVLGGGLTALGWTALPAWRAEAAEPPHDGSTAPTFGPASLTAAIVGMACYNRHAYVVTRGLVPAKLVEVNVATGKVTRAVDLPLYGQGSGEGGWATTVADGKIYVGMYPDAAVHGFDPTTGQVWTVGKCGAPGNSFVWSLATASDGMIFAVTYDDGGVWQIDPSTRAITKLGSPVPNALYGRFVAAQGDRWVYAGIYQPATLVRYDRTTGLFEDITPPDLRGGAWGPFATTDEHLYANSLGKVVRMNLDGTDPVYARSPSGENFDGIAVDPNGVVYACGTRSGELYRWVPGQQVELLGVPVRNAGHPGMTMLDAQTVLGAIGSGGLFTYDTISGEITVTDLTNAGFNAGPEPPQSMAVGGSTLYVGGHWGMQVHDTATWDTYRIPVPGEQKTLNVVDGMVYSAVYPSTDLVKIDPKARTVQVCGAIGAGQQRPWDAKYHPPTGQLVIASGPGTGKLIGALTLWNIHTNEILRFPNILPDQMVMSVWLEGDIAYIAGNVISGGNIPPTRSGASLAAFDVVKRELLWIETPVQDAAIFQSVAVLDETLYAVYRVPGGKWFSYDLPTRSIKQIGQLPSFGRLTVSRGRAYLPTVGDGEIYRMGPGLKQPERLWTGLGNRWYTVAQLEPVSGEKRTFWGLKEFDIAKYDLND